MSTCHEQDYIIQIAKYQVNISTLLYYIDKIS